MASKTITYFWSSLSGVDLLYKLEIIIIFFDHIFTKKVFSHDCKSRRRFITIVSRILMKLFCWCSLEIFNHFVAGSKNKKSVFCCESFFSFGGLILYEGAPSFAFIRWGDQAAHWEELAVELFNLTRDEGPYWAPW